MHRPAETGCRTRGFNPLGALAYVNAHGGADAVARVLGRLEKADLEVLVDGNGVPRISPQTWIPFMVHARLLRAVDAELGYGDLAVLQEVGAFMAQRDVPKLFGPVIRLGNPGWMFVVATKAWRSLHDHGRWEVERTSKSFIGTLKGHPDVDEAFCRTFRGWLSEIIPSRGTRQVKTEHPACRTRGAPHCIFTCSWT